MKTDKVDIEVTGDLSRIKTIADELGRVNAVLDAIGPLRDVLANEMHENWAHWMRYMFTYGVMMLDGAWTVSRDKVERWQRQMNTPMKRLSYGEESSDYEIADRVICVLFSNGFQITRDGLD